MSIEEIKESFDLYIKGLLTSLRYGIEFSCLKENKEKIELIDGDLYVIGDGYVERFIV
jgi:hypothetical protein